MNAHIAGLKIQKDKDFESFFQERENRVPLFLMQAPDWSPFHSTAKLSGDAGILFPTRIFSVIEMIGISPTMAREFSVAWKRRYKRSQISDWAPPGPFAPSDISHLFALAAVTGAYAVMDFYDLINAMPKLTYWFDAALISAYNAQLAELHVNARLGKLIRKSLLSSVGCNVYAPDFMPFFTMLRCPSATQTEFGRAVFSYIVEGVGSDLLDANARTLSVSSFPNTANAGRAYLHMPLLPGDTIVDFFEGPQPAAADPVIDAAEAQAPETLIQEAPAKPPKWIPPSVPEGVILTKRAERELRNTRGYSADRLAAAFACLADYRALRRGEISLATYNERIAAAHFTDSRCFADAGSLKAFASDYSVMHDGKRFTLDRHCKWGRGTNAMTGLRVYYTYDPETERVIIGSAPRHLPIWKTN